MKPQKQYLLNEIDELAKKALTHGENEVGSILLCLCGAIASNTEPELMRHVAVFSETSLAALRSQK